MAQSSSLSSLPAFSPSPSRKPLRCSFSPPPWSRTPPSVSPLTPPKGRRPLDTHPLLTPPSRRSTRDSSQGEVTLWEKDTPLSHNKTRPPPSDSHAPPAQSPDRNPEGEGVEFEGEGSSPCPLVAPVVYKRGRGGQERSVWQQIPQNAIKELMKALKEYGRSSPYFLGLLNGQLTGSVVVPHDLKYLFRCLHSKTEYQLWEATWKALLLDTLPSLLEAPDTSVDNEGNQITLKHLMGEGLWESPQRQAEIIPSEVLGIVAKVAEKAFVTMRPLGPLTSYLDVFQGPSEHYIEFVERLTAAVEQQEEDEVARGRLLLSLAFKHANEVCKRAILTLPRNQKPTLQDYVKVVTEVVPLMTPGRTEKKDRKPTAAAAAETSNPQMPHPAPSSRTPNINRRPSKSGDRPCTLCGRKELPPNNGQEPAPDDNFPDVTQESPLGNLQLEDNDNKHQLFPFPEATLTTSSEYPPFRLRTTQSLWIKDTDWHTATVSKSRATHQAIIHHYMDDVLVCAPSDDLLTHALDLTVNALVAAGFELQEQKIQRMPPWKYLGLQINKRTIVPQKLAIKTNVETLADVHQLCGALNWVRPWLGLTTEDLAPLFNLLKGGEGLSSPRSLTPEAKKALEKVQHLMSTRQASRCHPDLPFNFTILGNLPHLHGLIFQWDTQVTSTPRKDRGKRDPLLVIEWVFLSHQRSKRMTRPQELMADLIRKARIRIRDLAGSDFDCIHIPIRLKSGQITKVMLEHLLQENEALQFACSG
ncbi:hypothetical protein HGM15179_010774 [Zosterops borbonicus]|uniref:ribonuclease H n=1 Tax=Zosterops borbonicus TaxID=364589 RepID=A0A8K1GCU0_9PASS|nr:hypothetical protein HGM15179_010774 [Zosterops borbonicus]